MFLTIIQKDASSESIDPRFPSATTCLSCGTTDFGLPPSARRATTCKNADEDLRPEFTNSSKQDVDEQIEYLHSLV